MDIKYSKTCIKCDERFTYTQEDTSWDYQGLTPTKIVKCPYCNGIQAIKYELGHDNGGYFSLKEK